MLHTSCPSTERASAESFSYRYPRKEDYPTYDGRVESNHVLFIKEITELRDIRKIPDSEILGMLPSILTNAAKRWWTYELKQGYTTWNQWAVAITRRFSKDAWFRHLENQIQRSRFTQAHLDDPTGWANRYIELLESYDPDITVASIRHRFCRAM